jgi:hypothetical protein
MTLADRSPETIATSLRRTGVSVPEPRHENLVEELAETLRRMDAGETLDELLRRDPETLCALAMRRALTEHEAKMLLASVRYLEGVLDAGARERDFLRSWVRHQQENAALWGRTCAGLGKVIEDVARAAGVPHLAEQHELLAAAVQYLARDRQAPPARPVDANTAAIVRASEELAELRELARCVAQVLGQPGLEQDPARLGALLVEAMSVVRDAVTLDQSPPGDPHLRALVQLGREGWLDLTVVHPEVPAGEDCNCGGACTRRGDQEVCDTGGR